MKKISINSILERYKEYDIHFICGTKTLIIYKTILVKDLRNIQNIIRDYHVEIKNIIVAGGNHEKLGNSTN